MGRLAGVPGTGGRRGRLLVIALAVTAVAAVALALALFGPQTAGLPLSRSPAVIIRPCTLL